MTKFEVGKTYKTPQGSPRTVVYVDKDGWDYYSESVDFCDQNDKNWYYRGRE